MEWNAYNTKDQSLFDNLIKSSQTLIDTRIQNFPFFVKYKNSRILKIIKSENIINPDCILPKTLSKTKRF